METSYVYTPGGQPVARVEHNAADPNLVDDRYYYVHDRLGSVRLVVDETGATVNSYTYSAFGETLEEDTTVENPFLFTGQWYDAEIGQYYLRARMYDPVMMRFTGRDPVRGKFAEPMTLHR